MNDTEANKFFNDLVEGTDKTQYIDIELASGRTLEDVHVSPVDKVVLASVMERLPDEMFDAMEEADNPDEAEEQIEDAGLTISALTAETVSAFEDLVAESISHEVFTQTQIEQIVENLSFDILFELGAEIIELSFEDGNKIKDFHKQQ